jgi:hypothetical protein
LAACQQNQRVLQVLDGTDVQSNIWQMVLAVVNSLMLQALKGLCPEGHMQQQMQQCPRQLCKQPLMLSATCARRTILWQGSPSGCRLP